MGGILNGLASPDSCASREREPPSNYHMVASLPAAEPDLARDWGGIPRRGVPLPPAAEVFD